MYFNYGIHKDILFIMFAFKLLKM